MAFGYTNWRGEYAERVAVPLRIERKESEWHGPGLHWVMVAFDVEKQAERDFLIRDIGSPPDPVSAVSLTDGRGGVACDGGGWVFWNPDSGEEYYTDHPVESGVCNDAERIRRSTLQEDALYRGMQEWFDKANTAPTLPSSPEHGVKELEWPPKIGSKVDITFEVMNYASSGEPGWITLAAGEKLVAWEYHRRTELRSALTSPADSVSVEVDDAMVERARTSIIGNPFTDNQIRRMLLAALTPNKAGKP